MLDSLHRILPAMIVHVVKVCRIFIRPMEL